MTLLLGCTLTPASLHGPFCGARKPCLLPPVVTRRSHIEALISAAAAQEVQTELSRRVAGWRQRIDPVLAQEDARGTFDIHTYGEGILNRLSDLKLAEPAPVKSVMVQVRPWRAFAT